MGFPAGPQRRDWGSMKWLLVLLSATFFLPEIAQADDGLGLVDWLQAKGGFFSDKIEFRHLDPNDSTSPNGLFAKAHLAEDETIMKIPQKCMLGSGTSDNICQTAGLLLEQYHRGGKSFFKDYVNYLFDGTKRAKLPDRWSLEAKIILQHITGDELTSPLSDRTFQNNCRGSGDVLEEDAYDFVIARSWNEVMIPVYDMINHKNGHWRNVEATSAHLEEDITVYAYREVQAGEQLFISYNECLDMDCEGLFYTYGTEDIFHDYGFVEQYPQRWIFENVPALTGKKKSIVFELDQVPCVDPYDPTFNRTDLKVTWHTDERPDLEVISTFTSQIRRLQGLDDYVETEVSNLSSEHERFQVLEYHRALKLALQHAIWATYEEEIQDEEAGDVNCHDSDEPDDCTPAEIFVPKYDNLESRPVVANPKGIDPSVCHPKREVMGRGYDTFYEVRSQYQTIEYKYGSDMDDTCMWLSDWGQTCTSFRQYHEALVHYPASFVNEVKRVAYIGGGDNMILHEILKYPSIELVVGMELDQQVVRYSFMNLGTLPYFDDPRVQWWFGDATKSLLMLPEEYFGSFDLVLIDLQTFVADALQVTPDLTIMDTMKLLLKPEGIISKNEDFPNRQVVDFAKYTVDLEYCDLPGICRQSITIGSNGVDFLNANRYHHNVKNVYLIDSLTESGRFDDWFDFRNIDINTSDIDGKEVETTIKTSDIDGKEVGTTKPESLSTRSSNAVLLVIEAEELNGILKSPEEYSTVVSRILNAHGFKVLAVDISDATTGNDFFDIVLALQEGYIALRKRSEAAYVGIDLVLWNAVGKIDLLKESILTSIGGSLESSSSYRMVTGGMGGLDVEKPYVLHLAGKEKTCSVSTKEDEKGSATDNLLDSVAKEMIAMIPSEEACIVVVCGRQEDKCSLKGAFDDSSAKSVVLHECDNVSSEEKDSALFECEAEMASLLRKLLPWKINGIWLDSGASKAVVRVLLRLLSTVIAKDELLEQEYVVFTPITGEYWREKFLERFRTEFSPFAPSKEARIAVGGDAEVGIFSSGDSKFYRNLLNALKLINDKTQARTEVLRTMSGYANYVPDFDPPFYNNSVYDTTRAYDQWRSQTAVGFQTVFQFELEAPKTPLEMREDVLFQFDDNVWTGGWKKVKVIRMNNDLTYDLIVDDSVRTGVARDSIRRLDFDTTTEPLPTIEVGSRVLVARQGSHWSQGFVVSRAKDGLTYMIRNMDGGGRVTTEALASLIPQLEITHVEQLPKLSQSRLEKLLSKSLEKSAGKEGTQISHKSHAVGAGCIIVAFWAAGTAILTWDGAKHIDINLYTDEEDVKLGDNLMKAFLVKIPFLAEQSRDEQPRGYGHVVNFGSEIEPERMPIWRQK